MAFGKRQICGDSKKTNHAYNGGPRFKLWNGKYES